MAHPTIAAAKLGVAELRVEVTIVSAGYDYRLSELPHYRLMWLLLTLFS